MSRKDWTAITIRKTTVEKLQKIKDTHDLSWDQLFQELIEK